MPTKDKTYLVVDAFARWRISDPEAFFLRLRDERSARSRLDDIIGGEIRSVVAAHNLIEIVRSNRERQPTREEAKTEGIALQVNWPPIQSVGSIRAVWAPESAAARAAAKAAVLPPATTTSNSSST